MKWTWFKNALALTGVTAIVYWLFLIVWPLASPNGVVIEGAYRSLQIGSGKADVAGFLLSARPGNGKLKVVGYRDPVTNERVSIVFGESDYDLVDAEVWFLAYPSIHREYIELTFENDALKKIRYDRGIFNP